MRFQHVGTALCLCLALCLALQARTVDAGRRLQQGGGSAPPAAPTMTLPASAMPVDTADATVDTAGGTVEMKIINGEEVVGSDFNFMAALLANGRFFCGGVLISNDTVLTAAHCVVDTEIINAPEMLAIWLLGTQYRVQQIYAHPGYSASTIPNDNEDLTFEGALHDIAVVKLATPAAPEVPVVALASTATVLVSAQPLQVAGWGTTESGETSNVLKYGDVEYMPPVRCPSDYEDVLCAGDTGENTCNGDSGGPLILRDPLTGKATVVGITSHGPDCLDGPNYAYGYYTDVRQYLDAIGSWLVGKPYEWTGSSSSPPSSLTGSGSGLGYSGTGRGDGFGTGVPAPAPVLDGSSSGTSEGGSWTWEDVWCQLFAC